METVGYPRVPRTSRQQWLWIFWRKSRKKSKKAKRFFRKMVSKQKELSMGRMWNENRCGDVTNKVIVFLGRRAVPIPGIGLVGDTMHNGDRRQTPLSGIQVPASAKPGTDFPPKACPRRSVVPTLTSWVFRTNHCLPKSLASTFISPWRSYRTNMNKHRNTYCTRYTVSIELIRMTNSVWIAEIICARPKSDEE